MPDEPGRKGPPLVYLTFDDGPNPTATPALLDALRETGAHATFFLIDTHLNESTAPIVRRMFDEGHAVALHSDTRALMIKTPDELGRLLTGYADRIEQLAGRRPCRLFRPHAGWRSGPMYDGLDPDRSPAGRVELGPVGLELVPAAGGGEPGAPAGKENLTWRHRGHARRPPRESRGRSPLRGRGDAPSRPGAPAAGFRFRPTVHALTIQDGGNDFSTSSSMWLGASAAATVHDSSCSG